MTDGAPDALGIDWLDGGHLTDGLPGRIGLTSLPGRTGESIRHPGRFFRRDLEADLAELRGHGVRRLVLLAEDDELEQLGVRAIVDEAAALGIGVLRRPMPDRSPPASIEILGEILERIRESRARGEDVAVACVAGIGRTGTIAACALVEQGMTAEAAIATVRRARHPECVESGDQERFVSAYAASVGSFEP